MILDLNLPDIDGLSLLRKLRREGHQLPVLILTARDALDDRVVGLDAGSDDYMVKPFALQELNARLRALVRRSKGQAQAVLEYGDILIYPESQQVTYQGEAVKLTPHEYKLLQELISQSGRVLSRDQLQQSLYGWDEGAESNAVEVHIHHLRKKFLQRPHPQYSRGRLHHSPARPAQPDTRTMKHPRSIRRFLLTGILTLVSLSLTLSAFIGYMEASHEMEELFDARLAQSARITNQLLARYMAQRGELPANGTVYQKWEAQNPGEWQKDQSLNLSGEDRELTPYGHEFERNLYFQLLDEQGRLLLRAPSAPSQPLVTLAIGFDTVEKDRHQWRTFTLYNQQEQTWLVVAERDDERSELASKMATLTMLPLLITLPFLLALLWWLITRGLTPLRQLAQAISERHPANLSPLSLKVNAQELTPLTNEINRLMHTLADTIEREKQFTNEAAHELRTPLAVLRIHSENALAAEDEGSRQLSLHKMLQALDRSERLLRQLLTQARIDNQQELLLSELEVGQLLQGTLATLAPIALKKDQQLSLECELPQWVMGQATLLDLLFGNLIDNALRYTPPEGEIRVRVQREGNRVRVDVSDNGPGIAPSNLPRLCETLLSGQSPTGRWGGARHGHSPAHRPVARRRSRCAQPATRGAGGERVTPAAAGKISDK